MIKKLEINKLNKSEIDFKLQCFFSGCTNLAKFEVVIFTGIAAKYYPCLCDKHATLSAKKILEGLK